MESVMDRIDRWAKHLSICEAIPISAGETFEVAEKLLPITTFKTGHKIPEGKGVEIILKSMHEGSFKYFDHPVVVLK